MFGGRVVRYTHNFSPTSSGEPYMVPFVRDYLFFPKQSLWIRCCEWEVRVVWRKGGSSRVPNSLVFPPNHTHLLSLWLIQGVATFLLFIYFFLKKNNALSGCWAGALSGIPTMLVPQVSDNFLWTIYKAYPFMGLQKGLRMATLKRGRCPGPRKGYPLGLGILTWAGARPSFLVAC